MTTTAAAMPVPSGCKRSSFKAKLPSDFVPGEFTVICGRGKQCSESPGNVYLKSLIKKFLQPYSEAKTKAEKSAIVSAIVQMIQEAAAGSGQGIFVKEVEVQDVAGRDDSASEWWEVDESFKREKIGCMFRDLLHNQYRSSTKSKHARKKQLKAARRCNKSGKSFTQGSQQHYQRITPTIQMSMDDNRLLQSPGTTSSDCMMSLSSSVSAAAISPIPTTTTTTTRMASSKQYNDDDSNKKNNSLLAIMLQQHQRQMNTFHQLQSSSSPMIVMQPSTTSSSSANSTYNTALSLLQEACQIMDGVGNNNSNNNGNIKDEYNDLDLLFDDGDDDDLLNLSMGNVNENLDLPEGTLLSSVFD